MAGRRHAALKAPHRHGSVWEVVGEEAAAVADVKNSRKAPLVPLQRPNVGNLNDEQVARPGGSPLSILHADRAR